MFDTKACETCKDPCSFEDKEHVLCGDRIYTKARCETLQWVVEWLENSKGNKGSNSDLYLTSLIRGFKEDWGLN